MQLIEDYIKAKQAIYDHVEFVEDWVVCPIDDFTKYYWYINEKEVIYGNKNDVINLTGNHYSDEIYTQRFYKKHIYEGQDFTMIFCDPHTDGVQWFKLFDNKKKLNI